MTIQQASFDTVNTYRSTTKTFTLWFSTPDKLRTQTLSIDAESVRLATALLAQVYPTATLVDFKVSKFEPREFRFEFLDKFRRSHAVTIKASSRAEAYSKLVNNVLGATQIFALDND